MKVFRAYKFSLLLPLVVPVLFAPLLFVNVRFPEWLGAVILFTAYSGIIGCVPYLVLVALLLRWARGKSEAQFRRALMLSPLLMLPLFWVFILVISLLRFGAESGVSELVEGLLFYVPFVLGFGYGYVLLVFGLVFALKRTGVISPAPPSNKAMQPTANSVDFMREA
jgi:hypothetical protein